MKQDNYNIEEQWLELRELLKQHESLDSDIQSFLIKQNKMAGKRIRKKLMEIYKRSLKIRKEVLAQRKENQSDYENY